MTLCLCPESAHATATHGPPAPPQSGHRWCPARLTASTTDTAAAVIAAGSHEAERRDPDHRRLRIALIDGNSHQIDRIITAPHERKTNVTILIDLIHATEYVWKAAWCFYPDDAPGAEAWVHTQVAKILEDKAGTVGDFDACWAFHLRQEQHRVHTSRCKDGIIPTR
jgi:hypothetical protein